MDKNFLLDYEEREKEETEKFGRKFIEGKINKEDRYPSMERLKLKQPYTKSIDGECIWTQIPLYGTTIINLKPTKKELFEKLHGFDIGDIPRLMDFSRETGKVQFALAESPLNYARMDFLEPVFKELNPPRLIYIPLEWISDKTEIKKYYSEMNNLLSDAQTFEFIKKYIEGKYPQATTNLENVKRGIILDLMRLRYVGYEELVKDFAKRLTSMDITKLIVLHETIHDVFLYSLDPLKGIKSLKRRDVHDLNLQFPFAQKFYGELELPCEIGKFLNDKLKLIVAKDVEGAIALSDEYNLYDLRKMATALNEAVLRENVDAINRNSLEISLIFENVWDDADKLKKKISNIRYGISLGVGILGSAASLPLSGIGGFLAGLGFMVGDKLLEKKAYESISEKIAEYGMQSHVVNVYDFKKKYKLPS